MTPTTNGAERAIILADAPAEQLDRFFTPRVRQGIGALVRLDAAYVDSSRLKARPEAFRDVTYLFSTWGMPGLDAAEIAAYLPALRAVFYCSGTVQGFARPFLQRGVRVFSARAANAVPVAEFVLAQVLLANKGAFRAMRRWANGGHDHAALHAWCNNFAGNYGARVGLIGAGVIGRALLELLRGHDLACLVYDPYLTQAQLAALGAEKADDLPALFAACSVVSNHLPNKPETRRILNGALFERMPPYAAFINTGRGAQVAEDELAAVLRRRPDLTALLDVTWPEPPQPDNPLVHLENVFLTPHIAGSMAHEWERMSRYMLEEARCYFEGGAPESEIRPEMLDIMA